MNFKANITTKACTILILFAADQGTANTRAEFCSHPPFPQITSLAGFCVDTSAKKLGRDRVRIRLRFGK